MPLLGQLWPTGQNDVGPPVAVNGGPTAEPPVAQRWATGVVLSGYSGLYAGLVPDNFELRRTTSGLLRSARPDTGVLGTRPEDQPGPRGNYLLDFMSPLCRFSLHLQLVAGLGRDSLIYNGGGSRSLCWSVACALRPPDHI